MRKIVPFIALLLFAGMFISYHYRFSFFSKNKTQKTIKVGILHSLTGATAADEKQLVNATLLALDEINEAGGLLGMKLIPMVVDGKSDNKVFAAQAEQLITKEKVAVIFGCLTSANRMAVLPIVERTNGLLFYPSQYAGLELSPNIVYTGSVPNQQMLPGIRWCSDHLGKKFFLIGSDYIYPRASNKIMREFIASIKAEVVGEEYIPLDSLDVQSVIKKIIQAQPAVILSTLVGISNNAFFQELRKAGISSEKIPTISFSLSASDIVESNLRLMIGDYICGSYFQNINNDPNKKFITNFTKKHGAQILLSDTEASYFGPHLWAQAVQEAKSTSVDAVRIALKNQAYYAPEGIVHIDSDTLHTWKYFRIGKIQFDGKFNIFWETYKAIRPLPYPTMFGSKESWDQFINSIYTQWGNQWEKPKE